MPTHVLKTSHVTGPESFRERLQAELAARCNRNPRYSLRAFAGFLAVDHATLSQLMRGKRALTPSMIRRLGGRIGLSTDEIERHVSLEKDLESVAAGSKQFMSLAAEAASALLDGHAFAILELMRLREFRPDVGWIERMLGISADAINIALQHLIRLGFLEMRTADTWVDLTGGAVLHEEQFNILALERVLSRSRELQQRSALVAPEAPRFHGSLTLAVGAAERAKMIAAAEQLLRLLSSDAAAHPEQQGREQLYQFEIHCFPISSDIGPTNPER